MSGTIMIN